MLSQASSLSPLRIIRQTEQSHCLHANKKYGFPVKAVKAIPEEKRTDKLIAVLEDKFKTNVLYHTKSQDGDSKLTLLLQLCNEAHLILKSQPEMLQSEEVRILNRFLKEQSITHEESGKLLPNYAVEANNVSDLEILQADLMTLKKTRAVRICM